MVLVDPQEPGRIVGYQVQDATNVELVNKIKDFENLLGDLVGGVREHEGVDQLLIDRSVESLQVGFMLLVRAIFQPETKLKN